MKAITLSIKKFFLYSPKRLVSTKTKIGLHRKIMNDLTILELNVAWHLIAIKRN